MATKRRAQPKKRRSAKHRPARVAVHRAASSPTAGPAVFKREPPVIADTATCVPACFRAEHVGHLELSREPMADVPHVTLLEVSELDLDEDKPLGVVTLTTQQPRFMRTLSALIAAFFLVAGIAVFALLRSRGG